MKTRISKLLADYGMVVVLLILCAFFSAVTYSEQSVAGDAAIQQLAATAKNGDQVLLIGADTASDIASINQLGEQLTSRQVTVVAAINGSPKDARNALEKLSSTGAITTILCTELAGRWLVFENLSSDFPALATTRVIRPQRYYFPNFLKADNLLNIANQIAVIAIVAIGMTMVIIAGGIDLAVGSLIALSAVLASTFIRDYGGGAQASNGALLLCCLAAIALCGLIGGFSGFMVTRFDIPPFIVTLGMMLVASGLAYRIADGQSIAAMPDSFVWLGRGADVFSLPNAVLLMLTLYLFAHIAMAHMPLGRHIYAVGGNRDASQISGLPIAKVLLLTYIVSGLLAGLGGVIMASQLKSGSPAYGVMYELYVIAAVVVGGTSLSGGKGRMFGTLIGAFTIAVIQNGMNLTNVESYTQRIVLGLVILAAVLLDKLRSRS
jgi:ribose transport system permease protein